MSIRTLRGILAAMTTAKALAPAHVERKILLLRGERVMLDEDLADLYGVATKALVQAVKRNPCRFRQSLFFSLPLRKLPMCSV